MAYYLGMDVGGTKTHALIADEKGTVLGFGKAACGSYEYHGVDSAAQENRKALTAALSESKLTLADLSAVGLGVAGADLPEDFEMLEEKIYGPIFGDIPRRFRNDSMAALRGGTRDPQGIVIVCGTGSVCAGRSASGSETRVGGLGPEFGDACTGTGIGQEGLRTVWRAQEGIVAPTRMTDKFLTRSGTSNIEEFFRAIYRGTLTHDALEPMAELVFEAASEGDEAARAILTQGGSYLAAMVNAVARNLAMESARFPVIMAGSVFKGQARHLIEALQSGIAATCPKAECRAPEFEPVVGALLMAYEEARTLNDAVYRGLDESLGRAQQRYGITLRPVP